LMAFETRLTSADSRRRWSPKTRTGVLGTSSSIAWSRSAARGASEATAAGHRQASNERSWKRPGRQARSPGCRRRRAAFGQLALDRPEHDVDLGGRGRG
jgi:hypothetical protein